MKTLCARITRDHRLEKRFHITLSGDTQKRKTQYGDELACRAVFMERRWVSGDKERISIHFITRTVEPVSKHNGVQ